MFRTTGKNDGGPSSAKKPAGGGLRRSVTSLWAVCSKHASRTSRKLASNSSPRKLTSTISHKVIQFRQKKRVGDEFDGEARKVGGVWQRTILMGDKCQPLDFSGIIYYDSDGNQVDELPMRSPRVRPVPSYAYKSENSRLGW